MALLSDDDLGLRRDCQLLTEQLICHNLDTKRAQLSSATVAYDHG